MTENGVNAAVRALLERQVANGRQIGAQVCAYKDGDRIVDTWVGRMGPGDDRPVKPDSLFCGFSATKGVLATALHMCADRGLIDYKEPVSKYWPRFGLNGKEKITVEQVLSHQAGLHVTPPIETLYDWDATIRYIEELRPAYEPGTRVGYQAVNFGHIVGFLVQAVTGVHIKDFIRQEIAEPLGVADEMFVGVPDGLEARVTSLEVWDIPKILRESGFALPPDYYKAMPNECWAATNEIQWRKACIPAGNGYFTARALAKFYAVLACGGSIEGAKLLSPERIALMSRLVTNRLDIVLGRPVNRSLGFVLGGAAGGIVEEYGPRLTAFGHPGAGGSTAFADPEVGLSVAVMTNKMELGLQPTRTLELCNLIRGELGSA